MRFFKLEFWRYVLQGNTGWRNVWCRLRGHQHGAIYYNSGGIEPDGRCQDCLEEIA